MLVADSVVQGRYRVISQIGRGGMGTVYTARDENLGVLVALKQNLFDDQRLIEAFKREARLLAGLRHPTLPQVKDYFTNESGQFLVMEYIAGDDFETILEKRRQNIEPIGQPKPFEVGEVVQWAEQLLDALDYLHTLPEPVIHRDIKPENLKLAGRNQIILLDFGLAKGKPQWMTRVTTTGSIHGYTPNYAPMEQIHRVGTDPRSDLYALGATLYHLMTGTPPVGAATRADTVNGDEPDPLRPVNEVNPKVPYEIAAVLMTAMQQHRNNRPATAVEMLKALRAAKHSTVIDRHSREAETAANTKDVWPKTEIKIPKQAEEEQKAQEEAERKRRAEQELRAREEAERRRQQEEEELRAREQAEAVRQQREREERERKERETAAALEARRVQEERERRAEALRQEKAQEEAEALRQPEEPSRRPLTKETHVDEERKAVRRKVMIAIGAGVVVAAILIWVIVALNKSDGVPQSTDTPSLARLKASVLTATNRVSEVSFSDDGRTLASIDEKSKVSLWRADGEKLSGGPEGGGKCVAISPDGRLVASDSANNSILLSQASNLQKGFYFLTGHSGMVFSVGFSLDGQMLFSASYDKTIKLWHVSDDWRASNYKLIKTVNTPEEGYAIVAVSPDLRLVGFYNQDGSFKLWSLEKDSLIRMLDGDVPSVNCGAFSRDGQMLALGSSDGKVELWRVSDGRLMKSLGQFDADVMSVAISADGRVLAAGFKDGAIRLWRVSNGQSLTPLTGHTQSVNSLSFSGDGRTLASGSDDMTVRIWDVAEN
jgi:serine/threonine protein kinase